MDSPPVFEAGEEIFDFVALSVELFIEAGWHVAALSRRDAWGDAFSLESGTIFVAVIAFVSDHYARALRQCRIEQFCTLMVAHLSFGQAQRDRPALAIAHGVQFGVQTAPSTSSGQALVRPIHLGRAPF